MEDNLNYDEFEEFLQDQVRNQRMYPADGVWREIDKKLHGEKRWPALTIAAVMLVSATVLICVYFTPKPNIFSIEPNYVNTTAQQANAKNNLLTNLNSPGPFAKSKATAPGLIPNTYPELIAKKRSNYPDLATIVPAKDISTVTLNTVSAFHIKRQSNTKVPITVNTSIATLPTKVVTKTTGEKESFVNVSSVNTDTTNQAKPTAASVNTNSNQKDGVNNSIKNYHNEVWIPGKNNKFRLKNKFSFLIYFAPSISYRKLYEDNSLVKENNGGPVGINYVTDVNKVVRHKPGTGIEAGFSILYHLSNKVRLKAGFQFNMRQYSINAYRSSTELASITLLGANRIDTINTLAIYRNNNGYYSAQLVNRYYQLSVPAGIEWEIIGNRRIQFNVAGTIQPTYLLNRNAYLLSTNFKNYTENPGMVRQWNINSNIEAFMSFKVGDYKWQLGPQLRYQPYSTFIPQYPIKEHLMDYGVKLGLSKIIN